MKVLAEVGGTLPPPPFFLKSSHDWTLTQLVGNQELRFLAFHS